MMIKYLQLLVALVVFYPSFIWASFGYNPSGSNALALSYAGAAGTKSIFSAVNNPSLTPYITSGIVTSYRNYYGIRALADIAVGTVFYIGQWPLVIGAERKGFNLYAETVLTIGSGYALNKNIGIGLSLPVYALYIKKYGHANAVGISAAVSYRPFDKLRVTAIAGNLNGPTLGKSRETLPGYGVLAFAYHPTSGLALFVDVYKEDILPFEYRFGAAFQISPALQLLAGYRDAINSFSGGIDLKIFSYHLRYALELHPQLGVSHTFGISYVF